MCKGDEQSRRWNSEFSRVRGEAGQTHSLVPGSSGDMTIGDLLMGFIMKVSLLLLSVFQLLLVFSEGAKIEKAMVSLEDHGTRLRGLWKLHMRDVLLKGKGKPSHKLLCLSSRMETRHSPKYLAALLQLLYSSEFVSKAMSDISEVYIKQYVVDYKPT